MVRWEEVERESGLQLKYQTGGLVWTCSSMEELISRFSDAMDRYHLPYKIPFYQSNYNSMYATEKQEKEIIRMLNLNLEK